MLLYLRMDKLVPVKLILCSVQNGIKMKKLDNFGNIHLMIQLHMELYLDQSILFFKICKLEI